LGNRLQGKIAIISGAASGIGAAAAMRFVEEGARVVLGDVQADRTTALAASLGPNAKAVALDVREPAQWQAAVEAAAGFGALTTLVNSAGVSVPGTIEDISLDAFRHTLGINLEGTFLGCKAGIAAMKTGQRGSIINVGSTLGVKGGGLFPAYSSSKGAVRLLTRSVALHCAEKGYDIRVNCVLPGAIHTEMVEGYVKAGEAQGATREQILQGFASVHPMKRLGAPNEVADMIVFLASNESAFTTGADLPVDGGFLA
jgi:3alpha(or 20beta)-hydroxysteroid dehydrogenase